MPKVKRKSHRMKSIESKLKRKLASLSRQASTAAAVPLGYQVIGETQTKPSGPTVKPMSFRCATKGCNAMAFDNLADFIMHRKEHQTRTAQSSTNSSATCTAVPSTSSLTTQEYGTTHFHEIGMIKQIIKEEPQDSYEHEMMTATQDSIQIKKEPCDDAAFHSNTWNGSRDSSEQKLYNEALGDSSADDCPMKWSVMEDGTLARVPEDSREVKVTDSEVNSAVKVEQFNIEMPSASSIHVAAGNVARSVFEQMQNADLFPAKKTVQTGGVSNLQLITPVTSKSHISPVPISSNSTSTSEFIDDKAFQDSSAPSPVHTPRKYKCKAKTPKVCYPTIFNSLSHLIDPELMGKVQCITCKDCFPNSSSVQKHVRLTCLRRCDKCLDLFKTIAEAKSHKNNCEKQGINGIISYQEAKELCEKILAHSKLCLTCCCESCGNLVYQLNVFIVSTIAGLCEGDGQPAKKQRCQTDVHPSSLLWESLEKYFRVQQWYTAVIICERGSFLAKTYFSHLKKVFTNTCNLATGHLGSNTGGLTTAPARIMCEFCKFQCDSMIGFMYGTHSCLSSKLQNFVCTNCNMKLPDSMPNTMEEHLAICGSLECKKCKSCFLEITEFMNHISQCQDLPLLSVQEKEKNITNFFSGPKEYEFSKHYLAEWSVKHFRICFMENCDECRSLSENIEEYMRCMICLAEGQDKTEGKFFVSKHRVTPENVALLGLKFDKKTDESNPEDSPNSFKTPANMEAYIQIPQWYTLNIMCPSCGIFTMDEYFTHLRTSICTSHLETSPAYQADEEMKNEEEVLEKQNVLLAACMMCGFCNQDFETFQDCLVHAQSCFKEKLRVYYCHMCNAKLPNSLPHTVNSHMSNCNPFICKGCNQEFHIEVVFRKHAIECLSLVNPRQTPMKHVCDYCGQSFKFYGALNIHIQQCDSGPFKIKQEENS